MYLFVWKQKKLTGCKWLCSLSTRKEKAWISLSLIFIYLAMFSFFFFPPYILNIAVILGSEGWIKTNGKWNQKNKAEVQLQLRFHNSLAIVKTLYTAGILRPSKLSQIIFLTVQMHPWMNILALCFSCKTICTSSWKFQSLFCTKLISMWVNIHR